MRLSRTIIGISTAVALGLPAAANAFTPPPGMTMPGTGGTTGVCTIGTTKYGKVKFNGMEVPFDKTMCDGARGTFTAGGTASAVFDPTSAGGTNSGGTAPAPSTGGTTGGTTSGGTATAPAPS
ncbi:MAG: hypothetical protein ACKOYL_11760, partial [Actinomycetota bacterium]